jgi:hypothetical protein
LRAGKIAHDTGKERERERERESAFVSLCMCMCMCACVLLLTELDDKDKGRHGWDIRRRALGPIAKERSNIQLGLLPEAHVHKTLVPSLDHLALPDSKLQKMGADQRPINVALIGWLRA